MALGTKERPAADPAAGKRKKPEKAKKAKEKPEKQPRMDGDSPSSRAWPGPAKPAAVLVPRYVRDRRAAARTTRVVVFGLLGLALVVVGALGYSFISAQAAESDWHKARGAQTGAERRVAELQPIADYYDGLVARQETAINAMQGDLDLDLLNNAIYAVAADVDVTVETVTVASNSTPCTGSNPFVAVPSLGCLTVNVSSPGPRALGAFVDGLNKRSDLFNQAFVADLSVDGSPSDVAVNYSANALSLRYVPADRHESTKQQMVPGYVPVEQQPDAGEADETDSAASSDEANQG